jgi:hypothetical protein
MMGNPAYGLRRLRAVGERGCPTLPDGALALVEADQDPGPAVADGRTAVVMAVRAGWPDVARLSARLAVAEALAGRPDGSTGIVALVATPAAALAMARMPADRPPRLLALGIAAAAAPGGSGGVTARGLVRLAADALAVPAFEAATDTADLARIGAEGFAAALVPDGDPGLSGAAAGASRTPPGPR